MTVDSEVDDHVLVVTLNRPERRNAIDGQAAALLGEAFERFAADDSLHVAVLTGANGTFCAGGDLKAITAGTGNQLDLDGRGPMGPTRLDLTKPVIAAVEGFAVAGGLELAVWCDLRIAASDATFGVYCRRWGVPLVDGGTIRLPRLIGASHAADLILTGRAVCGEEALRIGLVNRLVEPGTALAVATALAHELAGLPQRCLRSDLRSSKDQWSLGMGTALRRETELGRATVQSGESHEGAARFDAGEGRHGESVT